MFMQNIPRRKIYETLLEYEDALIEMQIMLYSEENFSKYSSAFNAEGYKNLNLAYKRIKALLIMFLANKKYATSDEFEAAVNKLLREEKRSNWKIFRNRNFPIKFKYLSFKIDSIFKDTPKVLTYRQGKDLFKKFDAFNNHVPKILEIRRDKMK